MAKLQDLLPELETSTDSACDPIDEEPPHRVTGKKRRVWLEDGSQENDFHVQGDEQAAEKGGYKGGLLKGSIKGVHEGGLLKGSINTVHRPPLEKGSIKGVYRPPFIGLPDLRSNPLKLVYFLFELTKEHEDNTNQYETRRVKLKEIMQCIDISKDSARTALRFLLKQGLIHRVEFRNGRMGWSRYEIKKTLYEEIMNTHKRGSIDPLSQKGSNSSSSNNNITTNKIDPFYLKEIDVSPLEFIGMTEKHLLQLKAKTTKEVIQESIHHFAYGLQYNPKVKKYDNPMAVLISVLKRGEAWIEPDYRSPQEMAQEKLLASKKAEKQRLKDLEEQAYKIAFDDWQHTLSTEQLEKIMPTQKGSKDFTPRSVKLSRYFKDHIWPSKKADYLVLDTD